MKENLASLNFALWTRTIAKPHFTYSGFRLAERSGSEATHKAPSLSIRNLTYAVECR